MNIQLANVIADVVGQTGQKILRAIVAGERDGLVLGTMKNVRIHTSVDEIAKSLHGNWRAEHLFALKQALGAFDFVGTQLAECGQEIEAQLQRLQAVISETGADMSRFPTDGHFASWMGLCPGAKITGGLGLSGRTKRCANRAAQALRLAAAALRTSQSALGAYFRRMCSRMDKPKAVTAAAHKLARLIYTMLTKGEEYTDQGQAYYEERYRERVVRQLRLRANKLGMQLVAAEQPA